MKLIKYIAGAVLSIATFAGCTDLGETLYDQVASQNYYNTQMDVVRAVFRPFEHGYWSIQSRFVINELTADQLVTVTRDGWWDDAGKWRIMHDHLFDVENAEQVESAWTGCYQGIGQCNFVIEDLDALNPAKFGFSQAEFDNLKGQCRTLRAWFYIRLLDEFRNVPLVVSFNDQSKNTMHQVEPKVLFDFIETELKECIDLLATKTTTGGNLLSQGQFTKAAAAAMLVRLYLNAEVYIGTPYYSECAEVAKKIINGDYGTYVVADRWDAAFDWNNETCDEVIFGFPGGPSTQWHFDGNMYWWSTPARFEMYAKDNKSKRGGGHNCKWAASPSYNNDGQLFDYRLGMPVQKFRKYPGDARMICYKNLGNSTREGMFIYGRLEYVEDGVTKAVVSPTEGYDLYIRDAVGKFKDSAPDEWPGGESKMENGDHNSGWHFGKYPYYSNDDAGQDQSDFTEIRLPEVIYSLAECYIRGEGGGSVADAGKLLNSVRKRNYPKENWNEVLYAPEGQATLDLEEMLDEWGREFFAEGRRRIDLIRFGKFHEPWWDKTADSDDHTSIFPLMRNVLNTNDKLVQNKGYNE